MPTDPYALNPKALGGWGTDDDLPVFENTVVISVAQMLAFNNTSASCIELIPASALASNEVAMIERWIVNLQFGGVAYATGTGAMAIAVETALDTFVSGSGLTPWGTSQQPLTSPGIKSTSSLLSMSVVGSGTNTTGTNLANVIGKRVVLTNTVAGLYTAGNSIVKLTYRWRKYAVA
jgi:hypothetical protein